MNIRVLIIAAALCSGAAFAATPSDAAKAPADTAAAPATHKSMAKHHQKMARHHRASRHAMGNRAERAMAPSTDVNDQDRQARMDEALAKYRQQHS